MTFVNGSVSRSGGVASGARVPRAVTRAVRAVIYHPFGTSGPSTINRLGGNKASPPRGSVDREDRITASFALPPRRRRLPQNHRSPPGVTKTRHTRGRYAETP
ncbi:hypothetical protein AAFF_G00266150 [Aldrovandia affinis]|uniref:Uncharacterized protein n=1 Tax=Aldrovandia affinis TaxID=143900 RepID=A0AAD7RBG0_9TELE|nr:hypothetical protein AAFF_G00266150 [Aldrovandia affinis]